jgi:hypothetical protein
MHDIHWPHPPLDRDGDGPNYWRRYGEQTWHTGCPPADEPIEVWPCSTLAPRRDNYYEARTLCFLLGVLLGMGIMWCLR